MSKQIVNWRKEYREPLPDKSSTWNSVLKNHQPPAFPRVLHSPADHQLTDRSSTNPPTHRQFLHRPTDHQLTDWQTLLQLTTNQLTHQTYFSRVAIGPILSLIKFNWSFGLGTIYYWIRKIIHKMISKKKRR